MDNVLIFSLDLVILLCLGMSFIGLLVILIAKPFKSQANLIGRSLFDLEVRAEFANTNYGRSHFLRTYFYVMVVLILFGTLMALAPLSIGEFYGLSIVTLVFTSHLWRELFFKSPYFKLKIFSTAVSISIIGIFFRMVLTINNGAGASWTMILLSAVLVNFWYARGLYSYIEKRASASGQ